MTDDALIEAALLTHNGALNEKTLCALCEPPLSHSRLIDILAQLKVRWQGRGLQLQHSNEGWRFQIVPEAFERLGSLNEQRSPRYSRAVLETLAIIAYQQPLTRGDIEAIRGVAVSPNIMQTLQERGWIEAIGQRDTIGRPTLWATTETFLADLNLHSLEQLPPLTELGQLILPEASPTDTKDPHHHETQTESAIVSQTSEQSE